MFALGTDMNKQTVLVIDDDVNTRECLSILLEGDGFEVTGCENGVVALELIKENCFETIIIDYHMPQIKGDEVVKRLRVQCSQAYIIGISVEDKRRVFMDAGANTFVAKSDIIHALASLIKNKKGL
jgi:CheY-like chemotaxis protein